MPQRSVVSTLFTPADFKVSGYPGAAQAVFISRAKRTRFYQALRGRKSPRSKTLRIKRAMLQARARHSSCPGRRMPTTPTNSPPLTLSAPAWRPGCALHSLVPSPSRHGTSSGGCARPPPPALPAIQKRLPPYGMPCRMPGLRNIARVGAAARCDRPCHHIRRDGRDQHGARRNGDDRRLCDLSWCRRQIRKAVRPCWTIRW